MLGVAVDLDAGTMLAAALPALPPPSQPTDGSDAAGAATAAPAAAAASEWKVAFASGVRPGEAVGSGLYPAVSGSRGAEVKYNLGHDVVNRPMRHSAPAGGYRSVAAAAQDQVGRVRGGGGTRRRQADTGAWRRRRRTR